MGDEVKEEQWVKGGMRDEATKRDRKRETLSKETRERERGVAMLLPQHSLPPIQRAVKRQ